jgi:hypothetical protein
MKSAGSFAREMSAGNPRRRQAELIETMSRADGSLLRDIEQQIGPCLRWPSKFSDAMLSPHLRFPERWQLTLFLLGNRVPPTLIVEWYIHEPRDAEGQECA